MERPSTLQNLGLLLKRRGLVLVVLGLFIGTLIYFSSSDLGSTLDNLGSSRWPFKSESKSNAEVPPPPPPADPGPPSFWSASTSFNGTWDFERDRHNLLFNNDQCNQLFPDLYYEIDRAVRDRHGEKITLAEIDSIEPMNGYVRGMIYNQQLYVIQTQGAIYSRGLAQLLAINRAISTSPEPIPNLEFTFSVDDKLPPTAQWALARKDDDTKTWLMPDFAFWSWPETKVGSYGEIQDKALQMEDTTGNPTGKAWDWTAKIPKLMWRGATMGLPLRENLVAATKDKSWADVKTLDWHNKESTDVDLKSMAEHCQYKYLINTAGNSYSGRLKFIQNCRSVIFMHDIQWFTHHTHLMKDSGPEQNFVRIQRDFSDLEDKVLALERDDAKARSIADNNVHTLRERYLTPAAEVCYWRRLFRSWAAVSFEPAFWTTAKNGQRVWRGVPVESYVLERRLEWDPY